MSEEQKLSNFIPWDDEHRPSWERQEGKDEGQSATGVSSWFESMEFDVKGAPMAQSESEDVPDQPAVDPSRKPTGMAMQTYRYLQEQGYIPPDEGEDGVRTEEDATARFNDIMAQAVENRLKEVIAGLPDEVGKLVLYAHNGGNPRTYINDVLRQRGDELPDDVNLDSEDGQELAVRTMLIAKGLDDEIVEATVESLRVKGTMREVAEQYQKECHERRRQQADRLAAEQEARVRQERERRRKLRQDVAEAIGSMTEVGGLAITSEDRQSLPGYIVDATVRASNGMFITQMHRDLNRVLADDQKAILLAKLLRSDMNMSSLLAHVRTEVADTVRQGLQRTGGLPGGKRDRGDVMRLFSK